MNFIYILILSLVLASCHSPNDMAENELSSSQGPEVSVKTVPVDLIAKPKLMKQDIYDAIKNYGGNADNIEAKNAVIPLINNAIRGNPTKRDNLIKGAVASWSSLRGLDNSLIASLPKIIDSSPNADGIVPTHSPSSEQPTNAGTVVKNFLTTISHFFSEPPEHEMLVRKNLSDVIHVTHDRPNPENRNNIISTVIFLKNGAAHTHNKETYINGLRAMIKDMNKVYGDQWFLRVYFDDSMLADPDFANIMEENKDVDYVQFSYFELPEFKESVGHKGLVGTFVRYLPLFESFDLKVIKNCRARLTYYDKFKLDQWLTNSQQKWFCYNFPMNHFFGHNGGQYGEFITSRHYIRHHSASFASRAKLKPKQFLDLYKYVGISKLDQALYTAYGIDEYMLTRYMYEFKHVDDTSYETIQPFGFKFNFTQSKLRSLNIDPKKEIFNDAWERAFSNPKAEGNFDGIHTTMYTFGHNSFEGF